ncbi:MAG TPA: phosphatase domain-containing protein [Pirellulales bacterium]|nr:phosphatase domain-containing protein [Pirellulales bacterium]
MNSVLRAAVWLLAAATAAADDSVQPDETIVFFPTCAHYDPTEKVWQAPIHGWLFKPDERSLSRRFALGALRRALDLEPTPEEEPVFQKRGWPFVVESGEDREIAVQLGSRYLLLEAAESNGHCSGTVRLPAAEAKSLARGRWLRYQALATDEKRVLAGAFELVPPEGVSIISDIDDTIKVTGVGNHRVVLQNTFLRTFEPVPGMPELYRRWAAAGAVFHYVTASPWQLYPPLDEFRAAAGFPAGSFEMQMFRFKDRTAFNLLTSPDELKRPAIEALLTTWPGRRFVCVGDSGQRDPEMYAALARKHPEQIARIYIRNVTHASPDDERFRKAFADLPAERWRLFDDPVELQEAMP